MVVLLAPIFFFGYVAYSAYGKSYEAGEKRAAVEEELARVAERERALIADLEILESDRGVEAALRSRYRVGREGEQVIMLIDNTEIMTEDVQSVEDPGFFKRFLDIVF